MSIGEGGFFLIERTRRVSARPGRDPKGSLRRGEDFHIATPRTNILALDRSILILAVESLENYGD
jgi:hypothetical protein